MTAVSASLVKELREQTGVGMMDCKRALEETGGDLEAARTVLRERGLAQAGKRAGRETTEGRVAFRVDGRVGSMVAVGCETEPVSGNDEFLAYVGRVLEAVERAGPGAAAELEAERVELVARIGENVAVRGAVRYEAADGETLAGYVHPPASKIGVLVRVSGGSPEDARRLAMHIAFAAPRYASRDEILPGDVAAEREILLKRPDVESKPEQVRERIVEGMLAKNFYGVSVLADQQWIHDTAMTVGEALGELGAKVVEFDRFALSE